MTTSDDDMHAHEREPVVMRAIRVTLYEAADGTLYFSPADAAARQAQINLATGMERSLAVGHAYTDPVFLTELNEEQRRALAKFQIVGCLPNARIPHEDPEAH